MSDLPELPPPAYGKPAPSEFAGGEISTFTAYSADQLRAYGQLCAQLQREKDARICEKLPANDPKGPWFNDDMSSAAQECAAAIRGQQ